MITALIVGIAYILSIIVCGTIFIERHVDPSPISICIITCPIVNTIYCICRISALNGCWKNWINNL